MSELPASPRVSCPNPSLYTSSLTLTDRLAVRCVSALGLATWFILALSPSALAAPPPWSHGHHQKPVPAPVQAAPALVASVLPAVAPTAATQPTRPIAIVTTAPVGPLPAVAPAASGPPPISAVVPVLAGQSGPLGVTVQVIPAPALAVTAPPTPVQVRFVPVERQFGLALLAALTLLPLLLGLWLLAATRTLGSYRRQRIGAGQAALAAELGIAPSRLAGLSADDLARLQDKVAFDDLTGVMRRAGGLATLHREVARAGRRGTPLAIAFIDVDGLKKVNDTQGHLAGDRLLRDVADVLKARMRAEDAVFRYGGDEFTVVLPEANLAAAARIIDEALAEARSHGGNFSVGLAQLEPGEGAIDLLARADSDLYRRRRERGRR